MRRLLIALSLLGPLAAAQAQIGFEVGLPSVSIGINLPVYPQLVLVPGTPVYYAPRANSNYFFYDGLYWVYRGDNWYSSAWYNGPWQAIDPEEVPLFVLRVPVRYYRQPPGYFRGWRADAPPRWGQHWGGDWERQHRDWNQWDRQAIPRPAPLPNYQRQYSGDRYPQAREQQREIRSQQYRYQPREAVTRQHFEQAAPAPERRAEPRQPAPERRVEPRQQAPERRAEPRPQAPDRPAQTSPERQHAPAEQSRPLPRIEAATPRPAPEQRQPANPPDNNRGRGASEQERPQNRGQERGPDRANEQRGQDRGQGQEHKNDERGPDRR